MPSLILAENITKSYGDLAVLKGVDFSLEVREFVAITGASGSGKSTLLHILAGLDQPDSGTLSFQGSPYPAKRFRTRTLSKPESWARVSVSPSDARAHGT